MPQAETYELVFDRSFLQDLTYWIETDRKLALRTMTLVEAVASDPFAGIGKPEPLKGLVGTWSRRLTEEHRLVYRVRGERLYFLQARYQYEP
jgi:toxin YoeB